MRNNLTDGEPWWTYPIAWNGSDTMPQVGIGEFSSVPEWWYRKQMVSQRFEHWAERFTASCELLWRMMWQSMWCERVQWEDSWWVWPRDLSSARAWMSLDNSKALDRICFDSFLYSFDCLRWSTLTTDSRWSVLNSTHQFEKCIISNTVSVCLNLVCSWIWFFLTVGLLLASVSWVLSLSFWVLRGECLFDVRL